jgi:iron(III) transport system substrate-binding protein
VTRPRDWARALLLAGLTALGCVGCRPAGPARVVVYCAHDREFADEILQDFTRETGIPVVVRYDTESNKSVGLYEDLIREAGSPRCDVHWNNEILATIRLQRQGVLEPYASPAAEPFPARYKAADHTWTAFAARARVLLVNTDRVPPADMPRSLEDLVKPAWRGRVAMAKPLFGTTATQAACLFAAWGPDRARAFYTGLHANGVRLAAGNKQVAVGVGRGEFDVGLTDTDDAAAELDAGRPVAMIFPDAALGESGRGVLFIPNTVAVVKGGPNPAGARQLVDYLLAPAVEAKLARSKSRQIPLNPAVPPEAAPAGVETPRTAQALPVDFGAAADAWPASQAFLAHTFALR